MVKTSSAAHTMSGEYVFNIHSTSSTTSFGIAPPVGLSEYLVTAPSAFERTSAGGDEGNRALTMRIAPGLHVSRNIDGVPRRPRLRVEVVICARVRFDEVAPFVEEDEPGNLTARASEPSREERRAIPPS